MVRYVNYTSTKLLKVKKIKLPKKPKSFISEGNLSDKNTVKHSGTSGVKQFDVCNKSQIIQGKNTTYMNIQRGKE